MYVCTPPSRFYIFLRWLQKRFFKCNFWRFLSFWAGSSLTKKRQKEWSNWFFSFLWPPQMCLFWFQNSFQILKKSKKIQKRPLLHPKLEKSKKCLFKGRRSGQIDFFLFFDPPKCACSDSNTVFKFWKNPKKSKKTPFTPKIQKMSF